MTKFRLFVCWVLLLGAFSAIASRAQTTPVEPPCGVVDELGYPLESIQERTIDRGFDDFGIFRTRWGGNHTGLDIGFRQAGDPVRAMARGRVTYSNIEGWDTEKGVVIIEHYFPDGSRYFSLYGHVEDGIDIRLPDVGSCVEMGDIIAAVGVPSQSAPHTHFEVRNFLPDAGGPGYVDDNPLLSGWFHPLDFIHLWQIRLQPGYLDSVTFNSTPSVPPIIVDSGTEIIASDDSILAISPPNSILWRVSTDGVIDGLAALSGNRVIAHTENGQVVVLNGGRYAAVWTVDSLSERFVVLEDETLVFVTEGGGIEAYSATGELAWEIPPPLEPDARVLSFIGDSTQVAVSVRSGDRAYWRLVGTGGTILYEAEYESSPLASRNRDGSWTLYDGETISRIADGTAQRIASARVTTSRLATLITDVPGNVYLYSGDSRNTLYSWNFEGNLRWQTELTSENDLFAPLMATDIGCVLYTLDNRGDLQVLNATNGDLITGRSLYAGGDQTRRPASRSLTIGVDNSVRVSAGFLTTITFDGAALAEDA
ncbi:MAG: peptidoglycan DD-metalloendopeptidase family protein, partial [Aggregatilineales bacterium]